jgi:flagellar basal-body rod protein FlgC
MSAVLDPLQASLKVGASGLEAQSKRLRVLSENLANAQSTGKTPGADPYTRKTISFESELDEATGTSFVKVSGIDRHRSPYRIEHNPGHPAADAKGFVKLPNVDIMVEIADVREANRSYEANLQVIKQAREMIAMTIDLLRNT